MTNEINGQQNIDVTSLLSVYLFHGLVLLTCFCILNAANKTKSETVEIKITLANISSILIRNEQENKSRWEELEKRISKLEQQQKR